MMSTTQVMHTCAGGRLKVNHILHAVGPIWLDVRPERCTYELLYKFQMICLRGTQLIRRNQNSYFMAYQGQ
jgi:hypothetical protein